MTLGIGIQTKEGTVMIYDMYAPDPRFIDKASEPKDKIPMESFEHRNNEGLLIGFAGHFTGDAGREYLHLLQRVYQASGVSELMEENYKTDKYEWGTEESKSINAIDSFVKSTKDSQNEFMIGKIGGDGLFEVHDGKLTRKDFAIHGSGKALVEEYIKDKYTPGMSLDDGIKLAREAMDIALRHKPDSEHRVEYRGYSMKILRPDSTEIVVDPETRSVDLEKTWLIGGDETTKLPWTRILKRKQTNSTPEGGSFATPEGHV